MFLFSAYLFISTSTTFVFVCYGQIRAEILEHPHTQYHLTNHSTQFHCKAYGTHAYWLINNETVSLAHSDIISRLEEKGFSFFTSSNLSLGFHNLTLSVLASTDTNNTLIECKVIDSNFNYVESNKAYLHVFNSFRPLSPALSVDVTYRESISPQIRVSVKGQPLYPGYVISEFNINATVSNDGLLMKQIHIPNFNGTNFHHITLTLPNSLVHKCSLISISGTALSQDYGESEPYIIEEEISAALGNISLHSFNHTVYFYPNGTPILSVRMELPSTVCVHQYVNYTIQLEERGLQMSELVGPFTHRGPGIVTHDIIGLERDRNYGVMVQVMSEAWASNSAQHLFNTTLKFNFKSCTLFTTEGDLDGALVPYAIVTGFSSVLAVVVLFPATASAFVAVYMIFRRKKMKNCNIYSNRICNSLVNNPIYDGPVYESIQPKFETLVADSISAGAGAESGTAHISATGTSSCPLCNRLPSFTTSDKRDRYVDWSSFQVPDAQCQDSATCTLRSKEIKEELLNLSLEGTGNTSEN